MSERLSNLSSNENIFNNCVEYYNRALDNAGYNSKIIYLLKSQDQWFNRSYGKGNQQSNSNSLRTVRNNYKKQRIKNNKINLEGNNNHNKIYIKRKHRDDIPIVSQSTNDREYTLGSRLGVRVRDMWAIMPYGTQIKMNIVRDLSRII